MKYLCLIYYDEAVLDAVPRDEYQAMMDEALAQTEEMRRTGRFVSANRLEAVNTAATVRMRDKKLSVTDGPFAETKEQLGGYLLIEAADLNEAIQLAGQLPPARIGSVEVRPIMDIPV